MFRIKIKKGSRQVALLTCGTLLMAAAATASAQAGSITVESWTIAVDDRPSVEFVETALEVWIGYLERIGYLHYLNNPDPTDYHQVGNYGTGNNGGASSSAPGNTFTYLRAQLMDWDFSNSVDDPPPIPFSYQYFTGVDRSELKQLLCNWDGTETVGPGMGEIGYGIYPVFIIRDSEYLSPSEVWSLQIKDIPEPASVLLMGLGFVLFSSFGRRMCMCRVRT